ncbi:MAG: CubicO group peptidase (beta-lactamase class C family) [Candidatus Azotimanducaceae bacterium]|jgi:CubicO group peptidase (beta-lactamase class C family)
MSEQLDPKAILDPQVIEAIATLAEQTGSAQCCIVQGGQTLLDFKPLPEALDVFAVQKGILTLLLGIAEEQYLLETIDNTNHHLAPEWTQLSPWDEAKLSIETLLTMTTGMDDELAPLGEVNKTWRYNNTAYQYLKEILTQQSDMALQDLSQTWLFERLGMQETRWVERPQLLPNGKAFTGLLSIASDLVKIGEFILAEGKWAGQQVVPSYFVRKMFEPGSVENPAWGWGWWNNSATHYVQPMREKKVVQGKLIPDAPDDMVAARGAYGNFLYVIPSQALVIVRTCHPQAGKPRPEFESQLWTLLAARL